MDALRKQATKFREQVAKQQQAVLKQFSNHGPQGADVIITDEAELHRHQQLEKLFVSTRAGKHYQRDIIRGVEGFIATGTKQLELSTKLAEDCRRYSVESTKADGALAKASLHYADARFNMEKERDGLHRALSTQVGEPLRAMVMGAPLEDARHLTQRYDRLRQEAEVQGEDVRKRQARSREGGGNAENAVKLQMAEARMQELTSAMAVLGKEAAAAMTAVEAQQQRLTLQRLISMIEAERNYHIRLAEILDQLYAQMVLERQRSEALPLTADNYTPSYDDNKPNGTFSSSGIGNALEKSMYFLAEVLHPFDAEGENELTLNLGDYVVVRQVSTTGWSEGECKGKAGWFPSTYVERRQRVPASKVTETGSM
ncbi:hypothetical protein SELMODRAFT_164821 [Selaginella moellendorffii]|uniref:SH3 domain-containing protein n=1 Tax=Selaginella moellendorffii TaxID=88036 RepID=D8QRJ8_SELML|nr:SH3 domain-containing protein 2 [Selaginella moellendorffii]EFJ37265.1 hypothetical protein SELMODRAFT_164821 [Selaginella moellendorffii]|eukprot:XP_024537825.1 SH3 domain-containing protein 2 [Selaginella moellendorffii]